MSARESESRLIVQESEVKTRREKYVDSGLWPAKRG